LLGLTLRESILGFPASLNWPGRPTSTVMPTDSEIDYYCAGKCWAP
jgi:hypothetical protein